MESWQLVDYLSSVVFTTIIGTLLAIRFIPEQTDQRLGN